ncbi:acyl-CoA dehydrogenase family protein [Vulgatibacter incomptus]|uniref:Glutaryl-CoA dehydrogenase n=1 Tax=Vulgatibacter incomptus TaxID=1391653 RepID=A0A0K1PGN6_9BACT|nr:acyl-CoA dehydrogenase family protein [Vulgatibacter incomptus]AKU92264.1 Glutaryl-CoA dehydrogenase [Vulgatibacter incomptus]
MGDSLLGTDLFRLDDLLTDEQKLVRRSVRKLVDEEFLPVVQQHFRAGTFPTELAPKLGEMGLLGMNLQGYGCPGTDNVTYGIAMQELERGDSGLRSFCSVQGALAMYPIWAFGSEEQKERFLPGMAAGKVIGCFGLTEPDHGSDPAGMKTRARKDGDHYVLNGTKLWITNGTTADVAVVWAKTDDGGAESVRGYLVEKGMPGFEAREIHGKVSLRASLTAELSFHDVRVPAANVLPKVEGLRGPLMCLNQARYGIAWGATGAHLACFEAARDYSLSRIQFGKPIASFQMTQEKLVAIYTELVKAQLVNLRLGQLKDLDQQTYVQISFAKRNNVRVALEAARLAREILGANGITDDYPVIRHMVNLESVYTYEGTHDIHTLILGKELTGISAF